MVIQAIVIALLFSPLSALIVIGGNRTVIQGQNTSLPCRMTDTEESLSQVSWQRKTRKYPVLHNFFIISPEGGPEYFNGPDNRFTFIGNLKENNGSLLLSNVTLLDEGLYVCIFTLFPSGNHKTEIPLTVLVPPAISLQAEEPPLVANVEVTLAGCVAAGAKPPAEVRWHTGSLGDSVRVVINSTQHTDGTTTTVSHLVGIPSRDLNQKEVHCVISHSALPTEVTRSFTIEVHYFPQLVKISQISNDGFECVSDASPEANYTWSRVTQLWPESSVRTEAGTLQFLSVTADLSGLYLCEAFNSYGRTSVNLYVYLVSGDCTTCWTLFIILTIAAGGGVALWCWRERRMVTELDVHHAMAA